MSTPRPRPLLTGIERDYDKIIDLYQKSAEHWTSQGSISADIISYIDLGENGKVERLFRRAAGKATP